MVIYRKFDRNMKLVSGLVSGGTHARFDFPEILATYFEGLGLLGFV